MNIRIRKATPADLQKLQVVMALTFFNSYKGDADVMDMAIYTQHDLALDKIKAEMETSGNEFYVLEDLDEDVILAYTHLVQCAEFEGVKPESGDQLLEVSRLYVTRGFQGHGFGRQLLDLAEKRAHELGISGLVLCAWKYNWGGIRFYEREGFKTVKEMEYPLGHELRPCPVMYKRV